MKKLTLTEIFALAAIVLLVLLVVPALGATQTAILWSSVYDTGDGNGVALNSVTWQGNKPAGTDVRFQFASSNCANGKTNPPACNDTGTWTYRGPDGTDTSYYIPTGPDVPARLNLAYHNNHRYFRYKIYLLTDTTPSASPRVDDVTISWSP